MNESTEEHASLENLREGDTVLRIENLGTFVVPRELYASIREVMSSAGIETIEEFYTLAVRSFLVKRNLSLGTSADTPLFVKVPDTVEPQK